MRIRTDICSCATLGAILVICGCSRHHVPPTANDAIHLTEKLPALGERVGLTQATPVARTLIVVNSTLALKYELVLEGICFELGVDEADFRIVHISTSDARFVTKEGIRIGDTYASVQKATGKVAVTEPGRGVFVKLESGWNAAFARGQFDDILELWPHKKVLFLFRR